MLNNKLFYCKNKDTYPPFKNGLYLEEFFLQKYINENIKTTRKYIPVLWTNFQLEPWFNHKKQELQNDLNLWVKNNPSENGYFTIVQYDDGPLLNLPHNTIIYGACSGNIPIPLIYQDTNNTLENIPKKSFHQKNILCSFVGNITSNHIQPNVRLTMFNKLSNNTNFKLINSGGWTPSVNKNLQDLFIETTVNSKFALAPRGYGRASFRFFECFKLNTIPIYLWNDINWLPFQEIIDYNKLCIVLHINDIDKLENILININEEQYNNMFNYYQNIKHLYDLDGMFKFIINLI
ncbi:putative exostosin-like protein [Chlorella virus XW01]|nr:putative exostosin-like protein [Chlorella virus XW01]